MQNAVAHYSFSADQRALLEQAMELASERAREPISLQFGSSQGFEGARIAFAGHEDQPLLAVYSFPADQAVSFAVMELGPPPELAPMTVSAHPVFASAVKFAADRMAAFVQQAKAPYRQPLQDSAESERTMLRQLAFVLGKKAGQEGYAEFREFAQDAEICVVGILLKRGNLVMATFVITRAPTGTVCSVRNFQNQVVPGMPNAFPSVAQAIVAHQEYFAGMAEVVGKQTTSWWKRPFRN